MAWQAFAGTGTSTLTAQTSINTNCSISVLPVLFGNYDPLVAHKTTNLDSFSGKVTITCVKGTTPTIGIGLGANASGSTRRMTDIPSGDFLTYELYQPGCATVWGTSGGNLLTPGAFVAMGSAQYTICATIPAGQNPSVGSYADTVVVTVSF